MSNVEVTNITKFGVIEVRETVMVDGVPTHHRHVVEPGQSTVGEDDVVVAVAAEVHTQEVVDAYAALRAAAAQA